MDALFKWANYEGVKSDNIARVHTELHHIDTEFRQCASRSYRRMDFIKNDFSPTLALQALFRGGEMPETVSSWTTNLEYARTHFPVTRERIAFIFTHDPKPDEVWVRLTDLWRSPKFQRSIEHEQLFNIWQSTGERYLDAKKNNHEVILQVPSLKPADIHLIGGASEGELRVMAGELAPIADNVLLNLFVTGDYTLRRCRSLARAHVNP